MVASLHSTPLAIERAVRGDVGLMSWSFGLFICALAVLVTVQSLLIWCSRLQNHPFLTQLLWEFLLDISVYGSCGAVVSAIMLLVVTVLKLRFDGGSAQVAKDLAIAAVAAAATGDDAPVAVPCPEGVLDGQMVVNATANLCNLAAFGGNFVPGDAHLQFGVASKYPAILAFAVSLVFSHYLGQ